MDEDIRNWYDEIGSGWGRRYESGDRHFRRRVLNVHLLAEGLSPDSRVLDVGCATGDIGASLHHRFGCEVIGVDISREMVACCNRKYGEEGSMEFRVGDACNLPAGDGTVDLVVAMSVLEWITDVKCALSEAARVLVSGGRYIVSIPNPASPFRKVERLVARFRPGHYSQYFRSHLRVEELRREAAAFGLMERRALWHVVPGYGGNLPGRWGYRLGMMYVGCYVKGDG